MRIGNIESKDSNLNKSVINTHQDKMTTSRETAVDFSSRANTIAKSGFEGSTKTDEASISSKRDPYGHQKEVNKDYEVKKNETK